MNEKFQVRYMTITWWMIPIGGLVGFITYMIYSFVRGIKQGIFSEEIIKAKEDWAKFKTEFKDSNWMEIKTIDHIRLPEKSKDESIELYIDIPSLLKFLVISITILGMIGLLISLIFISVDNLEHSLLWNIFVWITFIPGAITILFLVALFLLPELVIPIVLIFEYLVFLCLGLSKDDIPMGKRWLDF